MKVQEFAALKVGDKIANDMSSSQGEVTEVTEQGVRVAWGTTSKLHDGKPITFLYVVNSTAWFPWRKVEEECNTCGVIGGHSAGCPWTSA